MVEQCDPYRFPDEGLVDADSYISHRKAFFMAGAKERAYLRVQEIRKLGGVIEIIALAFYELSKLRIQCPMASFPSMSFFRIYAVGQLPGR